MLLKAYLIMVGIAINFKEDSYFKLVKVVITYSFSSIEELDCLLPFIVIITITAIVNAFSSTFMLCTKSNLLDLEK